MNIKEQIKSIYQLDYISSSVDLLEEDKNLRIEFVNDTLEFSNNQALYSLSDETIDYIHLQEETRLRNNILFSGFGILLLGLGGFLIYKRKRENSISLSKVYPNPFENDLTIEFEVSNQSQQLELSITDSKGGVVMKTALDGMEKSKTLSLGNLNSGLCLVTIKGDKGVSKTVKVIRK